MGMVGLVLGKTTETSWVDVSARVIIGLISVSDWPFPKSAR